MNRSVRVGTRVIAVRHIGPVREGAPGIITGTLTVPFFFWKWFFYTCTFADNVKPRGIRALRVAMHVVICKDAELIPFGDMACA